MKPIEIRFKPGCDEAAEQALKMLDNADRKYGKQRVLSTGLTASGGRTILVRFDDSMDYFAFMVAIGGAHIAGHGSRVTRKGKKR